MVGRLNSTRKEKNMTEIIIKKEKRTTKAKRSSVVVSPETYIKVYTLAQETGLSVEKLVDVLLTEAMKIVKVVD